MEKYKVAFIITHPIQYYVPLLKSLASRGRIEIKVFYTWGAQSINKFDPGFNRVVEWDIPLLEGYNYEFLENVSKDPGTHHFKGIDNPTIIDSINQFVPDKIVVFGWSFKSHLKVLRYFKGKIPIYFRGDSHLLNEQSFYKKVLRKIFLRWVYSHVDYAIAVGSNNREYYRWVGLLEYQILFAPHAIDDNSYINKSLSDSQAINLREQLNIPENNVVFLYSGKFEYRKSLQTLISAKLLIKDLPSSLIMVGNGPDETELIAQSVDDPNIHFVDFVNQSQMPYIYKNADVFVLTSVSETWGLAINEAMISGLAIIATEKVGCAIDLIIDNGFVVKVNDSVAIASAMKKFIIDRPLLARCKDNSKLRIRNWSMSELIDKFESILTSPSH